MHTTFTGKTTEATAEGETRAEYTPHTTEHSQAAGQKIPRLPLRERQLTGVKVRRRRRRRLLRLRHRRRRSLGGRKQGGRTNELRPSERARRKEGFCAFFAASIRSLGGRGRLDRERERETKEGGGGGGAQKVAPHIHFLPSPTIDFESAAFVLGEARRRS